MYIDPTLPSWQSHDHPEACILIPSCIDKQVKFSEENENALDSEGRSPQTSRNIFFPIIKLWLPCLLTFLEHRTFWNHTSRRPSCLVIMNTCYCNQNTFNLARKHVLSPLYRH